MRNRVVAGIVAFGAAVGLAGLTAVPASAAELLWERLAGPTGVA